MQLTSRLHSQSLASCSRQATPTQQQTVLPVHRQAHSAVLCRPSQGTGRGRLQIVAGERQSSNTTTKRRLSSGSGLPPINGGDDGGGGGGDGWGWERTARNVLPNLAFLGMYFAITSFGGDGWGNGNFFGGGGGGGGGGGDGQGHGAPQPEGGSSLRDEAAQDKAGDASSSEGESDEDSEAPVYYNPGYNRREYR